MTVQLAGTPDTSQPAGGLLRQGTLHLGVTGLVAGRYELAVVHVRARRHSDLKRLDQASPTVLDGRTP